MAKVSEERDLLFHYTNGAGLKGILESQSLHATHYKYSNDTSEMVSIAPELMKMAEPGLRQAYYEWAKDPAKKAHMDAHGGLEKLIARDVKAMVDTVYKATFGEGGEYKFFEPYIVSFCGHDGAYERDNGLLSQWRGYGRDAGYAIVFDARQLEGMLDREIKLHAFDSGALGDVIYGGDGDGFNREFPRLAPAIKAVLPSLIKNDNAQLSTLYSEFVHSATRYKHQGFKEEREVRLFLSPRDEALTAKMKLVDPKFANAHEQKRIKPICFKDKFIPYIDVFAELPNRTLPIKKIIVGPHAEKRLREERLKRYVSLRKHGIEIICSETPLV